MATDTIYGLVGSALKKKTVERIYNLRRRNRKKPLIILISSIKDLNLFDVKLNRFQERFLKKIWPGKVSVILPCPYKKFIYLHRGSEALAFRLPKKKSLVNLLKATGPLVIPSANPEGLPPAENISQAKKYFKNRPNFYLNSGSLKSLPSTVIKIGKSEIEIVRQGAVKVSPNLSF